MSENSCQVNASEDYFCSYEDLTVHRLMLSDVPRMAAYKNAILSNKSYFEGSVVMDVGAGTGILSLFCALAGAKKVYAVEASSVSSVAKEVIQENNFSDVVEVLHGRVEDAVLPEGVKVDIIVSEWMGFYLLHESMLDSVIAAREKFLKPSGKLFPDIAHLFAAPCSTPKQLALQLEKDKKFWADVCGFKMNSVGSLIAKSRENTPEVSTVVEKGDLLSSGTKLFSLDLSKITLKQLDSFEARKFISVDRDGEYSGICLWFECEFPHLSKDDLDEEKGSLENSDKSSCDRVTLSTSPFLPPTHWKQTLIMWPPDTIAAIAAENIEETAEEIGDKSKDLENSSDDSNKKWIVENGEVVGFKLALNRDSECPRRYEIQLEVLDPTEEDHPIPCECGAARCTVIAAFLQQNEESSNSSFSTDGDCDVDD
ncbi:hypothetical protein J437_LFUL000309 [Ladona fulva]|uniref:type I protein arginine methyltransferase n=1 Tax=Ladona fulva TaxID=123851 RepID=A0A8K0K2B2_LADFU|nr:hypothetical protein J437_LFUL000309 [Ladona fulva]